MSGHTALDVHLPDQPTRTIHIDSQAAAAADLTDVLSREHLPLNTRCGRRGLCDGCLVELHHGALERIEDGQRIEAEPGRPLTVRGCEFRPAHGPRIELTIPPRSLLACQPQVVSDYQINVSWAFAPLLDNSPGAGGHPVGIAVDVGTTTVALRLVDLTDGRIIDTTSGLNRQAHMGDDVLTRINLCATDPSATAALQQALVDQTLSPLIRTMLERQGIAAGQVRGLVLAGNTTMLHLLAGIDPSPMGVVPFTAAFLDHRTLDAAAISPKLAATLCPAAVAAPAADALPGNGDGLAGTCNAMPRRVEGGGSDTDANPIAEAAPQTDTAFSGVGESSGTGGAGGGDSGGEGTSGGGRGLVMHLLPGAAAYVGADVVAGVFASGMAYARQPELLVDVGTNGEIVLAHDGQLIGCATAAGPAFEGSRLSCGVRAGDGAISRVSIDAEPFALHTQTIGKGRPIGICGSAYVDLLAEARRVGLLTSTGRFDVEAVPAAKSLLTGNGHQRSLRLAEGRGRAPIGITETDIASLLQAKAAIAAGILALLEATGIEPADIAAVHLAGGFGMHMDPAHAIGCGLLPGFQPQQVQIMGNTSLAGAYLTMVDRTALDEIARLARHIEVIELNQWPSFEDRYIDQLALP